MSVLAWKGGVCAVALLAGTMIGGTARSAVQWSGNGHFYELITESPGSWTDASRRASSMSLDGQPGYLATVTSAAEWAFLSDAVNPRGVEAWLGGSDAAAEGRWQWVAGLEAGMTFPPSANPDFGFAAWDAGEPNDFGDGEDYLAGWSRFGPGDGWNDLNNSGGGVGLAYVVEFDGLPEPGTGAIFGTVDGVPVAPVEVGLGGPDGKTFMFPETGTGTVTRTVGEGDEEDVITIGIGGNVDPSLSFFLDIVDNGSPNTFDFTSGIIGIVAQFDETKYITRVTVTASDTLVVANQNGGTVSPAIVAGGPPARFADFAINGEVIEGLLTTPVSYPAGGSNIVTANATRHFDCNTAQIVPFCGGLSARIGVTGAGGGDRIRVDTLQEIFEVPLPGSLVLAGTGFGLLAFGAARRRRPAG